MNIKFRNKIRKIFIKHDPMEIYLGTNIDEYDPEINLLVDSFRPHETFQEFLVKLHSVFIIMFDRGIAGPKSKYKPLAEELYDYLLKK